MNTPFARAPQTASCEMISTRKVASLHELALVRVSAGRRSVPTATAAPPEYP